MRDEEIISLLASYPTTRITGPEATLICKRLNRIATWKCRNYAHVDVDDIVAHAFHKALMGAARFRDQGVRSAATKWLITLTVNCAISLYRKEARIRRNEIPFSSIGEPEYGEDGPIDEDGSLPLWRPEDSLDENPELEKMSDWTPGGCQAADDYLMTHDLFYQALEEMRVEHPREAQVIEVQIESTDRTEACEKLKVSGVTYANYLCKAKKVFAHYYRLQTGEAGNSKRSATGGNNDA